MSRKIKAKVLIDIETDFDDNEADIKIWPMWNIF